jgi:hypothetical protein
MVLAFAFLVETFSHVQWMDSRFTSVTAKQEDVEILVIFLELFQVKGFVRTLGRTFGFRA